ncbi:peptide/nickel transport system substrate-binding protein [Georgenia satyanarayanai]|uniref:Peptide/nickel transport system substrate-binding protein n=1 Tax=Georgenia satyanarayanai TaxID=860221 RepID=A0A2Y8ZWQ9_9MICO|nr:ABC transporter substrate-binding protein [Georgenia satyanarayanai]PYG01595.1 peptide/nickel transport system substrate-binding protein [Georgenia satyanarayanai]SSA36395.1 peptide/nickel transport system substrate-binding protein [Georgenia satyanarayanai]
MSASTRRLVAAAAAALTLAACSTGEGVDVDATDGATSSGTGTPSGDVVVAGIAGEPDQLDPHSTTAYFSFQVLENVFDTLVQPDENLEMVPALAESWTTSEDQLTWTFTLREGVTWHDGSPFTADDVAYSFNRIIDEELANSWRFSAVESVEATDESTVTITVSSPSPNLLANIGGFKGVAIVQQENVESGDIGTAPVGTGPFRVERYATGESIELVANEDYWDGAPSVAGVTFEFIPEPTTAVAALQAGEIHWTDNLPPQQVASLSADDTIELGQVGSNDYWYLALNQDAEPYDDVEVRQAISYAIDREAITEATMYGNATVNQTAIPESSSFYTPYDRYSHDVEQARSLLEGAGVAEGDITLDLMVASDYPETVQAAQIIESQLSEVGIAVEIRTLDFGTWLDEQGQGSYDMLMMGWLGNLDPDDFYYAQHHSEGANNFQGYSNPEVDALLEQGRVETDEEARREIYEQVATQVADDASYIYLYNPDVVQAWSPQLEGYTVMSNRAIRFKDVSLTD